MQRFWKKVKKTDTCWLWTASTNGRGYGLFWTGEKNVPAHRFAFGLEAIPEGMNVNHKCDNTLCVNPRHLYAGTQKQNIADMYHRGRDNVQHQKGEDHGMATVSDKAVERIRKIYASGCETQRSLALKFNVSQSTIQRWTSGEVRA